ncbi:MAG: hypothetical protein ACRDFX_13210, partial [Chloroflexota bacterium]
MCYSIAGRVQTRLVALLVPSVIAAILASYMADPRFYTMLVVMVLVALDLDLFLYPRLIGYQSRLHMYMLGLAEFVLTLVVVRLLDGTLPLTTIIWFYLAGWIGGQLLVNALLPVIDFRWAEHGGEIFRPRRALSETVAPALSVASRAWANLLCAPAEVLIISTLLFLTVLDLTALPSALTPSQAVGGPAGALIAAAVLRRLPFGVAPGLARAFALGLVMDLLVRSDTPILYVIAGVVAVTCVSWLRLGGKPVFNGAACATVALVLFVPTAYSGEAQWGNSLFLPLVLVNLGILVALRSRALPLVASFVAVVAVHGVTLAAGR